MTLYLISAPDLTSSVLGKLCVPLLNMKNNEKKWWALKDKTLRTRAKGTFPQIQLEFELFWSPLRATYVTLNPKKEIHMKTVDKFKRQVFVTNVMRIKEVIVGILDFVGFIKSCLEWEDVPRSIMSFIIFMTVTYYFEPYMAPIGLLLFFLKHYIVARYIGAINIRNTFKNRRFQIYWTKKSRGFCHRYQCQ